MTLFALLPLICACAHAQAGEVAGAAVSSKEWKVTRSPQRQEEFSGDVRYKAGADDIRADWALYKHEQDLWQARGHVRLAHTLESGDLVKAAGDRAVWDRKTGKGRLTAERGVDFSREPKDAEPDLGRAGVVVWTGEDEVAFEDGVHVWGPRVDAWGDRGLYSRGGSRLDLTGGRPVVVKRTIWENEEPARAWRGAVKADRITALQQDHQVFADGHAVGWIEFPKQKGQEKVR